MHVISYLWAALFLIQAAGAALIIRQDSYSVAYDYDQMLPLAATGIGIVGSIVIGRYFAKKGTARGGYTQRRTNHCLMAEPICWASSTMIPSGPRR